MRTCKECKCDIEHMNMNTIYCSKKCRVKWNYHNNEEYRLKKLNESKNKNRKDGLKIYKIVYQGDIIYIGKTEYTLDVRKRGNYSIPKEILDNSLFEIIEYTDDVSRERFWIEHYTNLGFKLHNKRNGEGLDKREYYKEYYREYNKQESRREKIKENNKQYYLDNKEYFKEYNKKNKERIKEYYKEYNKNKNKTNE